MSGREDQGGRTGESGASDGRGYKGQGRRLACLSIHVLVGVGAHSKGRGRR